MHSNNKQLAKPSMQRRVEMRARDSQEFVHKPLSASQLAQQFCNDMIENLRHNVGEQKKRQGHKF